MAAIQRKLSGHTIICGFSATGQEAAAELIRRGCPAGEIVVVDKAEAPLEDAVEQGLATVHGDATHNAVLQSAGIGRARALIVTPGRDDTAVLIALTARRLAEQVPVAVAIQATENEILARDAGASVIVNPVSFGGQLLAGSSRGAHIADYVSDLVTSHGRIALRERAAAPHDLGRHLRDLRPGQGLRLYRDGRAIGFWEDDAVVRAGDIVIEVLPQVGA